VSQGSLQWCSGNIALSQGVARGSTPLWSKPPFLLYHPSQGPSPNASVTYGQSVLLQQLALTRPCREVTGHHATLLALEHPRVLKRLGSAMQSKRRGKLPTSRDRTRDLKMTLNRQTLQSRALPTELRSVERRVSSFALEDVCLPEHCHTG
jgi:hypothetical protein